MLTDRQTTSLPPLPQALRPIADQFVELLLDWNAQQPIIDFNLLPKRVKQSALHTDTSIVERLHSVIGAWDQKCSMRPSGEESYVRAKLAAAVTYSAAVAGEKIPFRDYIHKTIGVTAEYIPETEIAKAEQQLIEELARAGFSTDTSLMDSAKKLTSQSEIKALFHISAAEMLPFVQNHLNLRPPVNYVAKFESHEAYWMNWISTDGDGEIELIINTAERHSWRPGKIRYFVAHEICAHALQACSLREEIIEGRIHAVNGLTLLFGPEQFVFEGLGQTLPLFISNLPNTSPAKIGSYAAGVSAQSFSNAMLAIADGMSTDDAAAKMRKFVKWVPAETIQKDLEGCMNDPLHRTYQYVYGASYRTFAALAEFLPSDSKVDFLREIYSRNLTPTTLMQRFRGKNI